MNGTAKNKAITLGLAKSLATWLSDWSFEIIWKIVVFEFLQLKLYMKAKKDNVKHKLT